MISGVLIKDIVSHLQDRVACMDLYETVHGLAKRITDGDEKTFPAIYIGNGKYSPLEYSQSNGMAYFRKNGDVTSSVVEGVIVCENLYEYTIPLRLVSFIKLNPDCDDEFSDDSLAQSLDYILTSAKIKSVTNSRSGNIIVESYSTDRAKILSEEYEGIERKELNLEYSYLCMNMQVRVLLNKDCLQQICEVYDYCCPTTTAYCVAGDGKEREIIKYTTADQFVYSFPSLVGKNITDFQFGQKMLSPNQYSLAANGDVTLINTGVEDSDITFPIGANIYMKIKYK